MRERVLIGLGLALLLLAASGPLLIAHGRRQLSAAPVLQKPSNAARCILPAETMRRSHMRLLVQWREDVVRRNQRTFVAPDGHSYPKSLTGACLGCHDKQQFCDRCHSYAGVATPYCWNCHNQPAIASTQTGLQPWRSGQ
jgi:hypothetical protein